VKEDRVRLELLCHNTPDIYGATLNVLKNHRATIVKISATGTIAPFSNEALLRVLATLKVDNRLLELMCVALERLGDEVTVDVYHERP
jgi:hypothetical protein